MEHVTFIYYFHLSHRLTSLYLVIIKIIIMLLIDAFKNVLYISYKNISQFSCEWRMNGWRNAAIQTQLVILIVSRVRSPRDCMVLLCGACLFQLQSCGQYSPRDARQQLIIASDAERFPRPSDRPMEAMMRAPGLIRETVSECIIELSLFLSSSLPSFEKESRPPRYPGGAAASPSSISSRR